MRKKKVDIIIEAKNDVITEINKDLIDEINTLQKSLDKISGAYNALIQIKALCLKDIENIRKNPDITVNDIIKIVDGTLSKSVKSMENQVIQITSKKETCEDFMKHLETKNLNINK